MKQRQRLWLNRPADAVGKQVINGRVSGPVIGVVKDFHLDDMHVKIRPFLFSTQAGAAGQLSVKLSSTGLPADEIKKLMANMESIFKKYIPTTDFQSRFFDEALEQLYTQERQTSQIMNIAMGMAIFISCMGLFGLAAFTANQRTREIGIRKVLGAGVPQLVSLLGMVLTAMAMGLPGVRLSFWWIGGIAFIGIELVVHLALQCAGGRAFYDGRG